MTIHSFGPQLTALLVAGIAGHGCAPPAGDPGPGDAPQSTIETWMDGEIFGTQPEEGLQWALAFYDPGEGEVCMAFGLVEVDPGGGTSYNNLPPYTATVSSGPDQDGSSTLVGNYYHYNSEDDSFVGAGTYVYVLSARRVEVHDDIFGPVPELGEIPIELTNEQLVSLLQPCHEFEAAASPAPRTSK